MMQRRHHRHRIDEQQRLIQPRLLKITAIFALLTILFAAGNKTLEFFGVGNAIRNTAAILRVDDLGVVDVSVDGGAMKRAYNEQKLYSGDAVVTGSRNHATITFFDDTMLRMDENTQVRISESNLGEEASWFLAELVEGSAWLATPLQHSFSGAITREVSTPYFSAFVPSQAEVVMAPRSLTVYSADGLGLEVFVHGRDDVVYVGEGQQFTLPIGGEEVADLYEHRSRLDPAQLEHPFVLESRNIFVGMANGLSIDNIHATSGSSLEVLTVLSPKDGTIVRSGTLTVSGRIGPSISRVRINGYQASVNAEAGSFTQELALSDDDEIDITIEAIDDDGVVIAETLRTVLRDREPPESPTVLSPVESGGVFASNSREIEIRGSAPADAVGILVNDYRLQLFEPGDRQWSYLASTALGNMLPGENVYEVVAINEGGYTSDPVSLTIIYGQGDLGVATPSESSASGSLNDDATVSPPLLTNDPLMPGSVYVTSPSTDEYYSTSSDEVLIEGRVPVATNTVWVNGYRLRLYEPGVDHFNYIASTALGTMQFGDNVYTIIARDKEGQILDTLKYTIHYQQ